MTSIFSDSEFNSGFTTNTSFMNYIPNDEYFPFETTDNNNTFLPFEDNCFDTSDPFMHKEQSFTILNPIQQHNNTTIIEEGDDAAIHDLLNSELWDAPKQFQQEQQELQFAFIDSNFFPQTLNSNCYPYNVVINNTDEMALWQQMLNSNSIISFKTNLHCCNDSRNCKEEKRRIEKENKIAGIVKKRREELKTKQILENKSNSLRDLVSSISNIKYETQTSPAPTQITTVRKRGRPRKRQ